MKLTVSLFTAAIAGLTTVHAFDFTATRSLQTTCTACSDGSTPTNPNGTLPATNDGRIESCSEAEALAATLELNSTACNIAQAYFADPCGCPKPAFPSGDGVCTICADGSTPSTPDAVFNSYDGADVDCLTYSFFLLSSNSNLCGILQANVATVCGCPYPTAPQPPMCSLCSGNASVPDKSLSFYPVDYQTDGVVTCGLLEYRAAIGLDFTRNSNITEECTATQAIYGMECDCPESPTPSCEVTCQSDSFLNLKGYPTAGSGFNTTELCADIYLEYLIDQTTSCSEFQTSFANACCTSNTQEGTTTQGTSSATSLNEVGSCISVATAAAVLLLW